MTSHCVDNPGISIKLLFCELHLLALLTGMAALRNDLHDLMLGGVL